MKIMILHKGKTRFNTEISAGTFMAVRGIGVKTPVGLDVSEMQVGN